LIAERGRIDEVVRRRAGAQTERITLGYVFGAAASPA
jgi:hypothetical protein